jgi:hypothetical protein
MLLFDYLKFVKERVYEPFMQPAMFFIIDCQRENLKYLLCCQTFYEILVLFRFVYLHPLNPGGYLSADPPNPCKTESAMINVQLISRLASFRFLNEC